MPPDEPSPSTQQPTPPHAFAQGVGTVYQFVGVILFLGMMFICCGSGLLSRQWATRQELQSVGWRFGSTDAGPPAYSVQRAMSLSVTCGVFFGIALAGLGLGLQAERRFAGIASVALTALATTFWAAHAVFALQFSSSYLLIVTGFGLTLLFVVLLGLSFVAARQLWKNPPALGHDVLPKGYKIPYSHYHDDPPEVRLAAELASRRERLAVQQKELEALEKKIQRELDDPGD